MTRLPSIMFVVDPKKERIAIHEAKKLGVPIVAITDTNCDPEGIDMVIPANDDAIRAIKLFAAAVADACIEGNRMYQERLVSKTEDKEPPRHTETAPQPAEARPGAPQVEVVSRKRLEEAAKQNEAQTGSEQPEGDEPAEQKEPSGTA